MSIRQSELADALGVSGPTMSLYENAEADMKISNLPLISVYCSKEMRDFLPVSSKAFMKAVDGSIGLVALRYQRDAERHKNMNGKELKARIYVVDGREVIEPVSRKEKPVSRRELYRKCMIKPDVTAFSDSEFYEYAAEKDPSMANIIPEIYELELRMNRKGVNIRPGLPDYVVDELIIDAVLKEPFNQKAQKAYAYYYEKFRDASDGGCKSAFMAEETVKKISPNDPEVYRQMSLFDLIGDDDPDNENCGVRSGKHY